MQHPLRAAADPSIVYNIGRFDAPKRCGTATCSRKGRDIRGTVCTGCKQPPPLEPQFAQCTPPLLMFNEEIVVSEDEDDAKVKEPSKRRRRRPNVPRRRWVFSDSAPERKTRFEALTDSSTARYVVLQMACPHPNPCPQDECETPIFEVVPVGTHHRFTKPPRLSQKLTVEQAEDISIDHQVAVERGRLGGRWKRMEEATQAKPMIADTASHLVRDNDLDDMDDVAFGDPDAEAEALIKRRQPLSATVKRWTEEDSKRIRHNRRDAHLPGADGDDVLTRKDVEVEEDDEADFESEASETEVQAGPDLAFDFADDDVAVIDEDTGLELDLEQFKQAVDADGQGEGGDGAAAGAGAEEKKTESEDEADDDFKAGDMGRWGRKNNTNNNKRKAADDGTTAAAGSASTADGAQGGAQPPQAGEDTPMPAADAGVPATDPAAPPRKRSRPDSESAGGSSASSGKITEERVRLAMVARGGSMSRDELVKQFKKELRKDKSAMQALKKILAKLTVQETDPVRGKVRKLKTKFHF